MAAISILMPETVLIAAAVVIYLAGAYFAAQRPWIWIAAGAVALAAAVLGIQHGGPAPADAPLWLDPMARFGRWLALAFGALLLLAGARPQRSGGTPEQVGSLVLTVAGLMLVAGAGDLVLLFVGLELISIPTYVLLYLGRHDAARQEAAAKYFFLSVLSSAILLYGFSFLYGLAGLTDLGAVRDALAGLKFSPGPGGLSKLALALVIAGLCFRITAVPFHFYAPDVYQGTTYPNGALLSVLPKAAGFLVLVRLLTAAAPTAGLHLWQVVLAISLLTMTLGNLTALWQSDLRRLLAYSSIANAGYMLLGLAVALAAGGPSATWDGLSALWFFLAVYAFATIGAFAILEHLGTFSPVPAGEAAAKGEPAIGQGTIDEVAGLGRSRPAAAAVLSICLLSLTGLPPLAGFWGKLLIFGSALNVVPADAGSAGARAWFIAAAVLGVLNAAVAAAYYLRIVAAMYFRAPSAAPDARGAGGPGLAAVVCAALVLVIGFYPRPWIAAADAPADRRFSSTSFGGQEKVPPLRPTPMARSGGDKRL
jgi:NADH-quinone oxidoreductase subunit N